MERYFALYPNNEERAIKHYQANIKLAEAFYTSLSVLEVALRNALSRELETMTGREDWYAIFPNTPGLTNLNRYVTKATKQIVGRHETITPSKIIAELTLGAGPTHQFTTRSLAGHLNPIHALVRCSLVLLCLHIYISLNSHSYSQPHPY